MLVIHIKLSIFAICHEINTMKENKTVIKEPSLQIYDCELGFIFHCKKSSLIVLLLQYINEWLFNK